jgi:hypothetical protein
MKTIKILFSLLFVFFITNTNAQTPATEAGEDFDLYGAIGLFEESEDLQDFEKKLNRQENEVNNLDLNKDNEVDMIRLEEHAEGNTRLIIMQAVVGPDDYQNIASIELEKFGEEDISCQIIGDEEIYGPDYIIEPSPQEASAAGYHAMAVYVSVHFWRPVRVIFRPGRVLFVSTVVWAPRPIWFRPWRPIARATWRNRVMRWHNPRFRATKMRHSPRGRSVYKQRRRSSSVARKNYGAHPSQSRGRSTTGKGSNQQQGRNDHNNYRR